VCKPNRDFNKAKATIRGWNGRRKEECKAKEKRELKM